MKAGNALLVTAVVSSSLALAGCFSSSSSGGGSNGGNGGGAGSLEHDTAGVFQQQAALNTTEDFDAIVAEIGRAEAEDGPFGVLDSLGEELLGAGMASALSLQSQGGTNGFTNRSERRAEREATREERRSQLGSVSLLNAGDSNTEVFDCDSGQIVITYTYSETKDAYTESETVDIQDCTTETEAFGTVSLTGGFSMKVEDTWSDTGYTWSEDNEWNITGTVGGAPFAMVGSESFREEDVETDSGYKFVDVTVIPHLEFRLGDDYWAVVDLRFEAKGEDDFFGNFTETETIAMKIGSSWINGYAEYSTPKDMKTDTSMGAYDYCPYQGNVRVSGSGGHADILFGEDTGVAGQLVAITINGQPYRDYDDCMDFYSEFILF